MFGVGSLAALGVAIVSGFGLALGGPDWWHYNPVGHFFNSLHVWSVELFMALLVIHLWGKFWMAAWRGRRRLTWITGVVAFVASVIECFTGYLSPAELRLAVDCHQRQGRVQLGRGRRVLQRHELRPDADVAHRAHPDRADRHRRRARAAGPDARRLPPDRRSCRRGPRARALTQARDRPGRRRPLARPEPALRHPEGRHHRDRGNPGAHLRPGRPAVLPRRAAGHDRDLGQARARRLPGHGGHRAERHQRDRHLRPAVQQPQRQRPEAPVFPADPSRRDAAGQRGPGLRHRAAVGARATDPAVAHRSPSSRRPPPPSS